VDFKLFDFSGYATYPALTVNGAHLCIGYLAKFTPEVGTESAYRWWYKLSHTTCYKNPD